MSNPVVELMQSHLDQPFATPSPAGQWLQGTLRAADRGSIVVDFLVRAEMMNPAGMLHGGIAAAMLDECMGAAVFTLAKPYVYATVNLAVDYLASARESDVVTCTASVVREGNQLINMQAVLLLGDKVLARATSNLIRVKKL